MKKFSQEMIDGFNKLMEETDSIIRIETSTNNETVYIVPISTRIYK